MKPRFNPSTNGWMQTSLAELADIRSGSNAPQGDEYFSDDGDPFIRVQHFDGDTEAVPRWDRITSKAVSDYRLKKFPKGTIIFPKSGASIMLEKRAFLPFDAYLVGHLCAMNPKKGTSGKYLYYLLKTIAFSKDSGGTTLPFLNLGSIAKRIVCVPPLPEQKKIASVLAKIWRAVEVQASILENLRELRISLMNRLFTQGLRGETLKKTEIGMMPKNWDAVPISELGKVVTGTTPKTAVPAYWEGSRLFITPADMAGQKYVIDTPRRVTDEALNCCRPVPQGSICVSCIGTIGKVAMFKEPLALTNQQINSLVCGANVVPDFAYYQLSTMASRFKDKASQTTLPILNKSNFERVLFSLPPFDEQKEIASILNSLEEIIELHKANKTALEDLFKAMLNQLMTGQIRVKDLDIDTSEVEIA